MLIVLEVLNVKALHLRDSSFRDKFLLSSLPSSWILRFEEAPDVMMAPLVLRPIWLSFTEKLELLNGDSILCPAFVTQAGLLPTGDGCLVSSSRGQTGCVWGNWACCLVCRQLVFFYSTTNWPLMALIISNILGDLVLKFTTSCKVLITICKG